MYNQLAFIHIDANNPTARVTEVAAARKRPNGVGACAVGITVVRVKRAFVVITAANTASSVAGIAGTHERTVSAAASGIAMAVIRVE